MLGEFWANIGSLQRKSEDPAMRLSWNGVGLVTGLAAAAAIVLHLSGCVEEQLTEVAGAGDSATVVRGAGCVPEVLTSSTESTDTILVTFTATLAPDQYSCTPNLVQWGIDMADPVGVDTPQGNGYFRIETHPDLHISNMPSLPHAALGGAYSPAQVVIEFDPPVRSVEFYYSRRPQSRAWWIIDGRWQEVQTESTWVQATSRVPGTFNYTLYDEEHLYTNSSPGNWDGWTLTKLSAPADQIQWLSIFGTLAIDNLKIIRKPLNCTPSTVQRGQQVTCRYSSASDSVTGWEFQPDSMGLPVVQDTSTGKTWAGVMATGGTVTVHVVKNGTLRDYTARVAVSNRPSRWTTMQTYRQGPEPLVPNVDPGPGVVLGRNCPEVLLCVPTLRVQPDPLQKRGQGYRGALISTGPNQGYWYVAQTLYDMKRIGNINPAILPSSSYTHPLPATVPKKCRQGLGFGPRDPVFANFNRYNDKCQSINMTVFVDAVWGHEGFGYGGGQGHESLARTAAAEPQNDPYAAIEPLVYPDSATLESTIHSKVVPIAVDITTRSNDPNPTGNYPGGPMWYWDANSSTFVNHGIQPF